ncbi:MAG: DUF1599 domain-containing protein [Bacteroidia bacterium]|nr:DUF1599 domain-containing protein [Bacteroidia bacterium]
MNTSDQYYQVIATCKQLFLKKHLDYGASWQILRLTSVTDQLFIKAKRIRTIEDTGKNSVQEPIENEYVGLINYAIIALIILSGGNHEDNIEKYYDQAVVRAFETYLAKNQDYGEAWRDMRTSSLTDLILMKILRIRSIEDNNGKTIASEGVDANYIDILNYAVFALIQLGFVKN